MKRRHNERDDCAGLLECEGPGLADAGTPEAARFTELVDLIDAYTLARGEHDRIRWLRWWTPMGAPTTASR
jgi:hypothetical protein